MITYTDYTITRVPRGADPEAAGKAIKVSSSSSELVFRTVHGMGYKIHKTKVKKSGALVPPPAPRAGLLPLTAKAPPRAVLLPLPSATGLAWPVRTALVSRSRGIRPLLYCALLCAGPTRHAVQEKGRSDVHVVPARMSMRAETRAGGALWVFGSGWCCISNGYASVRVCEVLFLISPPKKRKRWTNQTWPGDLRCTRVLF